MSSNFLKLPDELILKIFHELPDYKNLKNCGRVCKKFYNLSHDFHLWKKVTFPEYKRVKFSDIINVISYGAESINLCNPILKKVNDVDENVKTKASQNNKLLYLVCTNVKNLTVLKTVLTLGDKLKTLALEENTYNISNELCESISVHQGLLKLNLKFSSSSITVHGIRNLFLACSQIQDLELPACLSDDCINALGSVLPSCLKSIHLPERVEDKHVIEIVNCCPFLIQLIFRNSSLISFDIVNKISSGLRNIQELRFLGCRIRASGALQESIVNTSLKTLEINDMDGVNSSDIEHVFGCFPEINKLKIFCESDKNAIVNMINVIPFSVRQLKMSTNFTFSSDIFIPTLFERCPGITELIIKSPKYDLSTHHP